MKQNSHSNKIYAVVVFYLIAISIRYFLTVDIPDFLLKCSDGILFNILTGIGPFVGSLFAIYVFGRKKIYSNFGHSVVKSFICLLIPVIFFFLYDIYLKDYSFFHIKIVVTCLIYAYFEEYGWRGYLQSELLSMRKIVRITLITILWFIWHLNFELSTGNIQFFFLLFLATWGIGQIAFRSHSIIACTCFHAVINISQNINLTTLTIALLILSIVLWFLIWYLDFKKVLYNLIH